MKPYKREEGYCVVYNRGDGEYEIASFTEDKQGRRVPSVYDTEDEAKMDIIEHAYAVTNAIIQKDMDIDSFEEVLSMEYASIWIEPDGSLLVCNGEYDDNELIDSTIQKECE